MTIRIQKSTTNNFSLSNCLDRSVYASRTYRMAFTNDTTKDSYSLVIVPTVSGNRFDFEIVEGTDVTFDGNGFYTWVLYEVNGSENELCRGKMKVVSTRATPSIPSAISNQTYVVADAGQ